MAYTGYLTLDDDESIASFYSCDYSKLALNENQYIFIDKEVYVYQNGEVTHCKYPTIHNAWENEIKPKDKYQFAAIDMLQDRRSKVKLIRGVYGSGKDYLMFNEALAQVEAGTFDKIVFVRPNVTLANVPQIGYLPNGVDEKLAWTLAPLYDKVGGEDGVNALMLQHKLEMVPLLFIRGRSFENTIVYVTEAQNTDSEIIKVLLGRIGEGSELWLNGDNHQTDARLFDKDNGLVRLTEKLTNHPLFGMVYLPQTHRSEIANLANLLDE